MILFHSYKKAVAREIKVKISIPILWRLEIINTKKKYNYYKHKIGFKLAQRKYLFLWWCRIEDFGCPIARREFFSLLFLYKSQFSSNQKIITAHSKCYVKLCCYTSPLVLGWRGKIFKLSDNKNIFSECILTIYRTFFTPF